MVRASLPIHPARPAFTLVEILVVISIMGLLMALALPAINRARENGRDTVCKNNLHNIGLGLFQYADSHQTICSGAFDWKHDGCVSEVGWIADLVVMGIPPGQMLCPSSPLQLNEQYQALLTFDPATNTCANSLGANDRIIQGETVRNYCRQLNEAGDITERASILEILLEKGYNSNYASSWLLTRSDLRIDDRGNLLGDTSTCPASLQNRGSTVGPMHKGRIGMVAVASRIVPIMACAKEADASDGILLQAVGPYPAATRLTESNSDGPVDTTTMRIPNIPTGGASSSTGSMTASVWWPYWSKTMQDYRDFGPVHGSGSKRTCNLLFLDGSVRHFVDENGDGFLNNGFTASSVSHFSDDLIELPAAEVYSGWSMDPKRIPRN